MSTRVAITGMGIVSALGHDRSTNHKSLQSHLSGIKVLSHHNSIHSGKLPVGQVSLSNTDLAKKLSLPSNNRLTRGAMLGILALKEALQDANLTQHDLLKTGFINGTSVGGMDFTEKYYPNFKSQNAQRYIETIDAGITTQDIADYFNLTGYVNTISTACSSGANAIMLGARLIKAGYLNRVVVGGVDCLSKFTLNGFNSLMLCSATPCKPFDEHRDGLNLGEAAAYLILEKESTTGRPQAFICGYGNANDAFHQTATSQQGDGAFLAMQKALNEANIRPAAIDYINVHGTATKNNDASESAAIQRVFEGKIPKLSSTKGFTGHTLAAAGAVEAVFSILSLQHSELYANLNFKTKMSDSIIQPITCLEKQTSRFIMSNSFGFGGNCTSLIFESV